MHERWEEWKMLDELVHGKAKEPSCRQIAEWRVDVYQTLRCRWAGMHG
jgi:hypothetical protein